MKTICTTGFKVSNADMKAFEYYLLDTPKEWAQKALTGMINKSVKTIMRDWIGTYKAKAGDSIPSTLRDLIPAIIAMEEFKPYNQEATEKRKAQRDEAVSIEIWAGGFYVEDYEFEALGAFYGYPEQVLRDYMENKISLRKEKFTKEHTDKLIAGPSNDPIPSRQDALINLETGKAGYKNRIDREAELL